MYTLEVYILKHCGIGSLGRSSEWSGWQSNRHMPSHPWRRNNRPIHSMSGVSQDVYYISFTSFSHWLICERNKVEKIKQGKSTDRHSSIVKRPFVPSSNIKCRLLSLIMSLMSNNAPPLAGIWCFWFINIFEIKISRLLLDIRFLAFSKH